MRFSILPFARTFVVKERNKRGETTVPRLQSVKARSDGASGLNTETRGKSIFQGVFKSRREETMS